MRRDVEKLFKHEHLLEGVAAIYDSPDGRVECEATFALSLVNEARAKIVEEIMAAVGGEPPLKPFTVMMAHEAMANRDIALSAFLVHPEFEPLLARARRPVWGMRAKVFVHDEIPKGDIYGLTNPEFLGVICRQHDGNVGILVTNAQGIIWGQFPGAW